MFKLPNQLTIAQVNECRTALLEEIDNNDVIEFDDSSVERIDTLGVQLLFAAVTYIASQNKQLIWHTNSSIIKKSIEQLGIKEAILSQYFTT